MSEFKFACPVCGQHITCDSRTSGSQMDCPTCFRKLVIPQASAGGSPNLVLTASEVTTRPLPQSAAVEPITHRPGRQFPVAAITLLLILSAAAGSAYVFRDRIFKSEDKPAGGKTNSVSRKADRVVAPAANDTNWMLNLADVKIPTAPACGRIGGHDFLVQRTTLQGGTLNIRRSDLTLTIQLFAKQAEDLAGKSINLDTNRPSSPKVTLRWKDDQGQAQRSEHRGGYALRLDFGQVAGTRMPGKIYLCTPDEAKSYVAGTFNAEIRQPSPPKTKAPSPPKPPNSQ